MIFFLMLDLFLFLQKPGTSGLICSVEVVQDWLLSSKLFAQLSTVIIIIIIIIWCIKKISILSQVLLPWKDLSPNGVATEIVESQNGLG